MKTMLLQPLNDLLVFGGAHLQTTITSSKMFASNEIQWIKVKRSISQIITTLKSIANEIDIPGLHPWSSWSLPAHLIQLFSLRERRFLKGCQLTQVCWLWNKDSHEIPNLVHRECDEGSVGCPQWKAIKAWAVYGTSDFSLWAFRRIFISVSWM